MTETPQELIAQLVGFTPGPWVSNGRYIGTPKHMSFIGECRDSNGDWSNTSGSVKNAALIAAAPDLHRELAASLAREAAETARCCRIITAARMGNIDGDFRSILHFVNSGNQMLFVKAAGKYMHDSKRADYEAVAALEKEGGE